MIIIALKKNKIKKILKCNGGGESSSQKVH
jgi:hypothetical protein